jgi:DNA-binding transcriptional LysR family regulator
MLTFGNLLFGEAKMNFTLRQLQVFRQAAKNLSFTKAANSLFMTSPAVLKQVRNLEDNLHVSLL